uniref:uncharacterized protein n=1 Tax=Myxine glutinosa TaxID=7769 RepID=UPI00358F07D4
MMVETPALSPLNIWNVRIWKQSQNTSNDLKDVSTSLKKIEELDEENRTLEKAFELIKESPELIVQFERKRLMASRAGHMMHQSTQTSSSSLFEEMDTRNERMVTYDGPGARGKSVQSRWGEANSVSELTNRLLTKHFSEEDLAVHSLTGIMMNPNFGEARPRLDPVKVQTIIDLVMKSTECDEVDVRYEIRNRLDKALKTKRYREKKKLL